MKWVIEFIVCGFIFAKLRKLTMLYLFAIWFCHYGGLVFRIIFIARAIKLKTRQRLYLSILVHIAMCSQNEPGKNIPQEIIKQKLKVRSCDRLYYLRNLWRSVAKIFIMISIWNHLKKNTSFKIRKNWHLCHYRRYLILTWSKIKQASFLHWQQHVCWEAFR